MHIMNEESHLTTFRTSRGFSNTDLIINNQLLNAVGKWEISDRTSFSDHSILKYVVGNSKATMAERYFRNEVQGYKRGKRNSKVN